MIRPTETSHISLLVLLNQTLIFTFSPRCRIALLEVLGFKSGARSERNSGNIHVLFGCTIDKDTLHQMDRTVHHVLLSRRNPPLLG
mmetsp:Transcript_2500/g.3809  ORF Transcript_2500/g.3809 Transcript_2500/m.3809 type:complete len:86 (+) Transcript_2500:2-259(+)